MLALLFILVAWLTVFPPEPSRIDMNHRLAFERIKELTVAEHNYAARHAEAGFACDLRKLGEEGLVNAVLASGAQAGYRFEVRCAQSAGQKITSYTAIAVPVTAGTTGKYALCSDQGGEIWYNENGSAQDCLAKRKPLNP